MLDSMRALSKSFVSKLLMALLVLSFGVWGIGDMVRGGTPGYAAKVGGGVISINEFQHQFSQMKQQLQAMGMNDVPENRLTFSVLQQLIQQHLVLRAMEDLGLYVDEALLVSSIRTMPEFRDKDGQFDAARFETLVKNQGVPERIFLAQLKQEIAGRFMIDSLDMSDAPMPTSVATLSAMVEGETRDVALITIPARDAMDEGNADALKEYYEENKSILYMKPESRTVKYAVISDAQADAIMKKSGAADRETALSELSNAIEDALAAGKNMSEAFAAAGITTAPVELSGVTQEQAKTATNDVTKTAMEQGFVLGQGEVSRLITTPKGARMVVTVTAITPASPKPFEEVKAQVKTALGQKLARDAAKAKALTAKEALSKAGDWRAVASEQKLENRMLSAVVRPSTLTKPDNSIPPALRLAIFERKVGEVAGPLALENGDQVLAVITESHLPKMDAAAAKNSKAAATATQEMGKTIEGRAYEYFVSRYPVKVNPGLTTAQPAASE